MGFAASSARLYMLVARKSDLEFQLQTINQSRMRMAQIQSRFYMMTLNLDPDNPIIERQQQMLALVQQQEKRLEVLANQIEKQHEAINTEIQSVRKVISNNIKGSFGLMAQG